MKRVMAFNFFKTVDEINDSQALDTDLKTWANAQGWKLSDEDQSVDISVDYDFEPEEVTEGVYQITFSTTGREFKIHTTDYSEEGQEGRPDILPGRYSCHVKGGVLDEDVFSSLQWPYIVWAVMMLVLPMALIALYSVMNQGNSIISFSFTLEHYAKFFTDPDFLLILWRSILIAVKTTVLCLLLGYPIAYYIARSTEKVQNILILCITLPMWINMLVRTYAWIGLLSNGGIFQKILGFFGLGNVELLYTEGAVLLGMVYNFLPFMILQIQTSLSKMDYSLIEASADLGASPGTDFPQNYFATFHAGSN